MQNPTTPQPKTKYFAYFHTAHKFRSHAAQRNYWLFTASLTDYITATADNQYCTRRIKENAAPCKQTTR